MRARRTGALLLAASLALACASGGDVPQISPAELAARADMPLVLDVRSPQEFASGHVPGATNIPHDEVAVRLSELGEPREVVVYCERGLRAAKAVAPLRGASFTVHHLAGDMPGWREAGLPVAR